MSQSNPAHSPAQPMSAYADCKQDDGVEVEKPQVLIVDSGFPSHGELLNLVHTLRADGEFMVIHAETADSLSEYRTSRVSSLSRSLNKAILMTSMHATATAIASAGNKVLSDRRNKPYYRQFEKKGRKKS